MMCAVTMAWLATGRLHWRHDWQTRQANSRFWGQM